MTEARRVPVRRGKKVELEFSGEPIEAYEGETVAAALLAANVPAFSVARDGTPRLPMCNMGTCFDCVVTIDGQPFVRACLTDVCDGMRITPHEAR